jgi:hypothetical protein
MLLYTTSPVQHTACAPLIVQPAKHTLLLLPLLLPLLLLTMLLLSDLLLLDKQ